MLNCLTQTQIWRENTRVKDCNTFSFDEKNFNAQICFFTTNLDTMAPSHSASLHSCTRSGLHCTALTSELAWACPASLCTVTTKITMVFSTKLDILMSSNSTKPYDTLHILILRTLAGSRQVSYASVSQQHRTNYTGQEPTLWTLTSKWHHCSLRSFWVAGCTQLYYPNYSFSDT